MTDPRPIAVLTGDLINSTALGSERIAAAMTVLQAAAQVVEGWTDAPLHFTRHRGDGWQVVLFKPKYAIRSALYFRACLKAHDAGLDSAIGMAEGIIETDVGPDLNIETADPFVRSGRALELARRSAPHMNHSRVGAIAATVILCDRVCREWTKAQAAAMCHAMHPDGMPDYTEIGETLGKSRQAVTKALAAAWHDEVSLALIMLESEYP